jgi:DnaK suppressor protein
MTKEAFILNDQYAEIKAELELTKKELAKRLADSTLNELSEELVLKSSALNKEREILHHIKDDLQDVERALAKMETGTYGICEETNKQISLEKLRTLPTARTIYDFTLSELVEKRLYPQTEHPLYAAQVYSYQ